MRDVVVVARDGKPVRISDVAEVEAGFRPAAGIVGFNGTTTWSRASCR